ncbi:MAG: ATP-binding cassette domain-containing protein [Thermoguttaceae bacterium]|nr:ATP-binding cassette domain-containing protein [Thermoguttaceae bacterium]
MTTDETKKDDAATNGELKPVRVEPNVENGARPYPLPNLVGESNPEPSAERGENASERLIEGAIVVEDGVKKVLRRRPPLLEIQDLNVIFGENQVLRDINLKVRRGETVAVIGESGCGKTVLLKNMIGLIAPTSGRVLFKGKDLARASGKALTEIRTHYGFVFQMAALFDSMTIADNVAFPLRQHRRNMRRSEIKERVESLLEEVGLNPKIVANKTPAEISGGMRKRVGFARALAMEPELMLYDEPTTGLDPIMSDVINEQMIEVRDRRRVAGVLITHDMKSAEKVADRIVMLYPHSRLEPDEPQMIFDGTPEEIERATDPRVAQFIRGEAGERLREMAAGR